MGGWGIGEQGRVVGVVGVVGVGLWNEKGMCGKMGDSRRCSRWLTKECF